MKTVAVVGTGIMGHGMALNFMKKGYRVFLWNRTTSKMSDLIKRGALAAETPKQAAENAEVVFEVTADDQSSRSVWLGNDGIVAGAKPGIYLIASSTISATWTDRLASICAWKRLNFFDIPLTGGRSGAENGKLILLAGGSKEKLTKIKPVLKAISQEILYFGKTGSGMRYKLLLNMLQAMHVTAFGEVMKLASKTGLNTKMVGESLTTRPGGTATNIAWNGFLHAPKPINFSVDWITKDLTYARKLNRSLKLPLFETTLKKYEEAVQNEMGKKDWTAVNKL